MKKIQLMILKDKKFKFGGYATIISVAVISVAIAINLLAGQIPLKIDLTKNRLFSLSEQTYQVIRDLEQDVTIYGLYETGDENRLIAEVLQRYSTASKKIHIKYVDPIRNPAFAQRFEREGKAPGDQSLIVSSGSRFKVLSKYDLYDVAHIGEQQPRVQSLDAEQKLTGALLYVSGENLPVLAVLSGHGETLLPSALDRQLKMENFILKELNFLSSQQIPETTDILLLNTPERDLSESEAELILEYLTGGGRAIFLISFKPGGFPRLNNLLSSYGVSLQNRLVVEEDSRFHGQLPVFLLPELESHVIVDSLRRSNIQVFLPFGQAIDELKIKKSDIEVMPLLVSSPEAYSEAVNEEDNGITTPNGPFSLAVAIKAPNEAEVETRIVVIGSGSFLEPDLLQNQNVPGNINLFMNSLNWLNDQPENISIRPKSLLSFSLRISRFQGLLLSGLVVILIPSIVFSSGLLVWSRRRRR